MLRSFACCPWMKASLIFAAGIAVGVWLPSLLAPRAAVATEDKAGGAEARLRELKIELPPVQKPKNTFVNTVRVGDMLYVSGTGPAKDTLGRLGQELDVK